MASVVERLLPATFRPRRVPLYNSLDPDEDEIRLLTILPDRDSRNIRCRLSTHSLKDLNPTYRAFLDEHDVQSLRQPGIVEKWTQRSIPVPQANLDPLKRIHATQPPSQLHRFAWGDFAALSYVWGDAREKRTIVLNDQVVEVTVNLERALQQFRNAGDFRYRFRLWVDALCINQKDLDERASLIQKMPSIYGSAWSVVAWVGKGSPRSGLALQLVQDFATFKKTSCASELETRLQEDPHFLGSMKWLGLHELMTRSYWYRLWIIQEIVMGGVRTMLRCGDASLDWESFCSGIAVLQEHLWFVKDQCLKEDIAAVDSDKVFPWTTTSLHLVYRHLSPLSTCKSAAPSGSDTSIVPGTVRAKLNLGSLLDLASQSDCSDPRDKVFSLVGLMPLSVAALLHPQYTVPVANVYEKATRAFIEGLDNLEALREANPWGPTHCPSWTADWLWFGRGMQRRMETPLLGPNYLFPRDKEEPAMLPYKASRDLENTPKFLNNGHLICRGLIIGRISGLSARGTGYFDWDPGTVQCPETFVSVYGDEASTSEALFRTLVGDRDIYRQKATARHGAVLHIPSRFAEAGPYYQEQGWTWLAGLGGYYYRWEEFRMANKDFCFGPFKFDNFFSEEIPPGASEYDVTEAYSCFDRSSQKRRLMTTSTGHIGWAPDNIFGGEDAQTKVGDLIAIVFGCSTPLAIRSLSGGERYQVLGEAYVQGLMDGEAIDGLAEGKYESCTFTFC